MIESTKTMGYVWLCCPGEECPLEH